MASVEVVDMRREFAQARKLAATESTNGAGPSESKEVPDTIPLSTALVAALRETAIVFATIVSALVLRERITPRRLAATALIVAGAVAMRLT